MTDTRPLPEIVKAYLRRCLPNPPAEARGTLLEQDGTIRLDPDKPWMPFSAEQRMDAFEPGFVWHARFKMAPLVTGVVEDAFECGHGRLDAKIWGVIPVAHARGIEVDRGEVQRYLAELPWCPLAFRHNYDLHFEEQSDRVVRVWVDDPGTSVDLLFGEDALITGARCLRNRGEEVQPWEGAFSDYEDFGGVLAPAQARAWWDAPEGRFEYWRGTVTSLSWRMPG
ncbi:MAG: hypothetical protein KDA24_18270 [Deltaproteobacteria bacterium]|nr:hypothetical protein [Deltaproteobacteria bacterium]